MYFYLNVLQVIQQLCGNINNQACVCAKLLQSCPTLSDPIDCTPAGSSVHGILQARILEWTARPSSRGSSQPGDRTRSLSRLLHRQAGSVISAVWEAHKQA